MKKNGFGLCLHEPGQFIKCLLMMKFTILLVVVFSFQSFGNGYGQDNISLNLEKVTFKKVFKAIEQQGVFRFVYKDEILPRDQRISIAIENASLEDVLNRILRNTELSFRRLSGSLVVITAAEEKPVISVTGKVTDEKGEPLPGVNIIEKGTNSGTTTNNEGIFVINVEKSDAVLVFTYIGFLSAEVEVASRSSINVQLTPANKNMQEVVVVGYGVQKKALVTGAISSVKSEQLETVSSTRIDQALQGRTAGVVVLPTSGQPGAGLNIRIRGASSNRNSNPLYIIDGVRAGGIEYIDPSEIATIDILKDAASAAIYGAEGSNGVIIITTKTGKRNTSEASYSGQYSEQSLKKDFIKMMNAQQYQQYLQEAGVANAPTTADLAGIGAGTNWLDHAVQAAPQQHHSLQFSGGSDKSTYLVSGTLFTQEGIVGGDKSRFNRYTVRFNGEHKIKPWLTIGNRLSYSHHKRRAVSDNDEFGSILSSALVMDPITPVVYTGALPVHVQNALAANKPLRRDENGNIYGISNFLKGEYGNPLARMDMAKGENTQNKIVGNVYMDIAPFKGFTFTSRFGVDAAFQTGHGWTPTFWFSDESQNTIANGYDYNNNWYTWQFENFATYKRNFGVHNFTLLGGVSAIKTHEYHIGGSYSGLFKEDDRFSYADYVPDNIDRIGSNAFDYTLASLFGRLNYSFNDRYLFNASLRRDGSSKLAPGNQWKLYPAVSAGWVLSNENFYPAGLSDKLNYVKLRGSWGQNGNVSSVGIGEWMNAIGSGMLYPDGSGTLIVGAAPTSLANPELTWETGEQFDIGADLAFFNNRLNLTVDYYKKTTKDMLTGGNAPLIAGNTLRTKNAGNVVNKGWEFELSYINKPISKDGLTYEVSANLSTLNNEVTYLDPNSPVIFGAGIGTGWSATAMKVGLPLWYFNGYQTSGIFQTQDEINSYLSKTGITGYSPKPGEPIVVDVNGDKQISPADMTKIGSPHPSLTYGGRASVSYKGFDLIVFVQGQTGNDILMGFNRTDRSTANKPYFFYANRWTGPGSTNTWFAANTANPYIYNSDLMIFNGAYTRIRQLQLGYSLPENLAKKAGIRKARIYVSLDDFFTFTKYPGVDPEGGSNGQNSIGIDRGGYPIPRKAIVGLSFNF
ncbi:TonB-dependent receptor [Terrimonas pollutisoli]|uniref:TonB-dependent receptor n=1 Tax=Terrimonas pollutisoli TaxID=3034147 RepID=UPI0023EBCD84|nr:TonB-dependent receptor [Terrimonas sp. H1YJ31]